jgi:uncharacterized protein YqgC (DUF456 family)
VVPVFIVFLILWLMSMLFTAEDYWTSFLGYQGLPTKAGFWWTGYVVAALPSVGQIAAGYIALALGWDAKEDRKFTIISILIWLLLFGIDAFTDMSYRMSVPNGATWQVVLTAVFQTVGIFTIGSELSFVVGFGMTMQLFPEAVAQSMTMGARLKSRMGRLRADMAEMASGNYR